MRKAEVQAASRRWDSLPARFARPRAHLFLLHGTHEHCGRQCYQDLAFACNSVGVIVSSFDFHGHGRRGTKTTHGDFGTMDDAIAESIELIKAERSASATSDLPIVIFGHSLGSLVAFLVAHELRTSATLPSPSLVVLSGFAMDSVSPPFGVTALTPVLRAAPTVIHKIVSVLSAVNPNGPACPLPPPSELTHDTARAADSLSDPLMYHGWIQNRTGLALMEGRARCTRLLREWGRGFPVLMVHGGEDSLCPLSACEAVMRDSPQPDKTLRVYDGCFHEVFNERLPERETAVRDVVEWIEARLDLAAEKAGGVAGGVAGGGLGSTAGMAAPRSKL